MIEAVVVGRVGVDFTPATPSHVARCGGRLRPRGRRVRRQHRDGPGQARDPHGRDLRGRRRRARRSRACVPLGGGDRRGVTGHSARVADAGRVLRGLAARALPGDLLPPRTRARDPADGGRPAGRDARRGASRHRLRDAPGHRARPAPRRSACWSCGSRPAAGAPRRPRSSTSTGGRRCGTTRPRRRRSSPAPRGWPTSSSAATPSSPRRACARRRQRMRDRRSSCSSTAPAASRS